MHLATAALVITLVAAQPSYAGPLLLPPTDNSISSDIAWTVFETTTGCCGSLTSQGFFHGGNPIFTVGYSAGPFGGESRGLLEFELAPLPFNGSNGFLNLYLVGSDSESGFAADFDAFVAHGQPPGTVSRHLQTTQMVDVYAYTSDHVGHGDDSSTEFERGTLLTRINQADWGLVTIDASAVIASAITEGRPYIGFNFRPVVDSDLSSGFVHYFYARPAYLGGAGEFSLSPMSYKPIPEPATAALVATGVICSVYTRMRRKRRWSERVSLGQRRGLLPRGPFV